MKLILGLLWDDPLAVIVQHHAERLLPLFDHRVGVLDLFAHPHDQFAFFVTLLGQFLDASVTLLKVVLKRGNPWWFGGLHGVSILPHFTHRPNQ